MAVLLGRRGDEVKITKEVVKAAAGNKQNGKEVMVLLLRQQGDDAKITEEVVVYIAESFDKEVMALLLERRGDDVLLTEGVVEAAARNRKLNGLAASVKKNNRKVI